MSLTNAAQRKLQGIQDSRSTQGILSRGANVYNGGTSAANNQVGAQSLAGAQSSDHYWEGGIPKEHAAPPRQSQPKQQEPTFSTQPWEEEKPQEWGFDPWYEEEMSNIREHLAGLEADRQLQMRRLQEDRARHERELGQWRDDALEANTVNMADRGLVHSGINIGQQADIGEDFLENMERIGQISSRAKEDISRQFAQQRQQLTSLQRQLELERAEREAERQRDQAERDAINRTPEPTTAGRYNLGSDQHNEWGIEVENLFNKYNVPIASSNETDIQRLQRIVNEIAAGQRDMEDVEKSIRRLSGLQGETGGGNVGGHTPDPYAGVNLSGALTGSQHITGADRSYLDDPSRLAGRIEDIFSNRGVDLGGHAHETAEQRLLRMLTEVGSGRRSMNDIRNSVDRLASL